MSDVTKVLAVVFNNNVYMALLKDNIALAHLSQIVTRMLETLCSMHFSHTLSFTVHRTLDGYYLNINSVEAWSDSRVSAI